MILQYRNTPADSSAHFYLINPKAVETATTDYQYNSILWVILVVVGMIWGSAVSLYLGFVYLTVLIYLVYQISVYPRKYRDAIEQTFRAQHEKGIVLTVTDEGITELCDDIESFVPWKAIVSYHHVDDRLFILLKSDQWAIIPKSEITEGAEYFDPLIERLAEKGIPAKSQAKK